MQTFWCIERLLGIQWLAVGTGELVRYRLSPGVRETGMKNAEQTKILVTERLADCLLCHLGSRARQV